MHRRDGEVRRSHLLCQPINLDNCVSRRRIVSVANMAHLSSCIAEDDSLSDGKRVIQIAEGVEFPILLLHGHEELLDAFQRQLVTFDEDANGVGHEFCRHLQNVVRQSGAEQHNLRCWR